MISDVIEIDESVGRGCFDSRDAGRKRPRTRFIKRAFVEEETQMSVDRISVANLEDLVRIHNEEATGRNPARNFHGWYVFSVESVLAEKWQVKAKRTINNPWHALIIRADDESQDVFEQVCNNIALQSTWENATQSKLDKFLDRAAKDL